MTRLAVLTGATGFVGGHVMHALAERGWRLRILTRRWPTTPPSLATIPIETVVGDLDDEAALTALVRNSDAVIHMAGAIKARRAADFDRVNLHGSDHLFRAWRASAPDAPLIHLSSMAAREPSLSPYAASKRAAEDRLQETGGRWTVLRPCAVYGPLDRETLKVFRLADAPVQFTPHGDGARLCLVHVADLAAAVAELAERPAPGRVFEITDARRDGYRWTEIASAAARALGREPRPARVPAFALRAAGLVGDLARRLGADLPDRAKIRETLHPDWSSSPEAQPSPEIWRPRVALEQGFAETVAAYRAAGLLRAARRTRAGVSGGTREMTGSR